ncbi:hypothetical protein FE257_005920 [Aspergillus nanangensis]|uniref:TIL domain-containing protein n=1 Tax=Aspergillus nanangensis TaxID=2582783 RepID=A0AAD4GVB8_ASPNN|nr:hypothetical protein FE257_005920 [Aspergillus nanangensis]
MKVYIVLAALVVNAMAYNAVREQPCRADEVYNECGSLCHPTCENIDDPPEVCPAICVAGCYCADPLLRSVDEACVPEKECPAQ